jgi:hypothetical protein
LDVTTDPLPVGFIVHIPNADDRNPSNVPATETTASPQLAQLTTEDRASPFNTLPFQPHSLSTARLDDLASTEFICAPDNGDGDAENVDTAEATVSTSASVKHTVL